MNNSLISGKILGFAIYTLLLILCLTDFKGSVFAMDAEMLNPQSKKRLIDLSYNYPNQVIAGNNFEFTFTIKKETKYLVPGMISFTFLGGLQPQPASFENIEFTIEDNMVLIEWDELTTSNIISFSFPVSTNDAHNGMYPVKVNYADDIGEYFSDYFGINIYKSTQLANLAIENTEEKSPYSIKLRYPEQVAPDMEFHLQIVVAKGKNTGQVDILVQIPPFCEVKVQEYGYYHYDRDAGKILIKLKNMPVSPGFTIDCIVKNTSEINAVYPIKASAVFQDGTTIFFDDVILLTKQSTLDLLKKPTPRGEGTINKTDSIIDEADNISSDLEKLLNTWIKSTTGDIQNNKTDSSQNSVLPHAILEETIIFYSVQIVASYIEMPDTEKSLRELGINERVLEDLHEGIYRYTVGVFDTFDEANLLQKKISLLGHPDAFVVEYQDGVRTAPSD